MSKYKNHKKKSIAILLALAKWMEESDFDYEIQDLEKALNDPNIAEFSGMGRDEKTRILNQDKRETMEKSIEEKNRKNPPTYNPQPKD